MSKEEQNAIDEEVPYFVTKGSLGGDPAKSKKREALKDFWSTTEAGARTGHTVPSAVLGADTNLVTPDFFTPEKFLHA